MRTTKAKSADVPRRSRQLAERPRSLQAYQSILRLIQARQLVAGSRLPTQAELRQQLGLSNDSITTAMRQLALDGVIQRRPKAGTLVVDPQAGRQERLWTVGILSPPAGQGGVLARGFHEACQELQRHGCTSEFHYADGQHWFPETCHYPGLAEAMACGRIDGLLAGALYDVQLPIPAVTITECPATSYVSFNSRQYVLDAMLWLHGLGHRRLGWHFPANSGFDVQLLAAHAHLAGNGLDLPLPVSVSCAADTPGGHFAGGQASARGFLAECPPADRPEAWVLCEDITGAGFVDVLARESDRCPDFAVVTNLELPVHFAAPVFRFQFSLVELAQAMVKLLAAALGKTSPFRQFHSVTAHRDGDAPRQ